MNYNYLVQFMKSEHTIFLFLATWSTYMITYFLAKKNKLLRSWYFMFVFFLYEWTRKCISHIISRKYATLLGQYYWILFHEYYVVKTAGKSQICSTIFSNGKLAFQNENSNLSFTNFERQSKKVKQKILTSSVSSGL